MGKSIIMHNTHMFLIIPLTTTTQWPTFFVYLFIKNNLQIYITLDLKPLEISGTTSEGLRPRVSGR